MEHGNSRLHAVYNNTSFFRVAYIIDLFLCSIGYVNVIAEFGKVLFIVWGLSIFFNKYIADRKSHNIRKVNYYFWLLLFIASNILTVFVRGYDFGIWESLLMIINMPLIFFLFYGLHAEGADEKGRKRIFGELYVLSNIFMWLSLVVNIISLYSLYAIGNSVSYTSGYLVVYENRFTGIYYNPNLMAFSSFCCFVCCHILLKSDFVLYAACKKHRLWYKVVTVVSAILNVVVIFLTDSNASAIILICYIAMNVCHFLFGGKKLHLRAFAIKAASIAAAVVLIAVGVFAVRLFIQTGTTYTMSTEDETNAFEDNNDTLNQITFEHTNKNLDSGRLKLLQQGLNVIKHHPFLGVGKGNITKYGNRYNDNKMKYSDFHNGYLTIMVCSGMIGFVIFMTFAMALCMRMCSAFFKQNPKLFENVFPCLFSFVFAYCIYSLFEKTMVYEVSFMITFFWLILGYAAVCMVQSEGEKYQPAALFKKIPYWLVPVERFLQRKIDTLNVQTDNLNDKF